MESGHDDNEYMKYVPGYKTDKRTCLAFVPSCLDTLKGKSCNKTFCWL